MSKPQRFGQADCVSVRSLYENFLRSATTLFGNQGVALNAQNPAEKLFVQLAGTEKIMVQTKREIGFWISGLPRHKGNKSDVIEVCLNLVQQVARGDRKELVLASSNVHVSYFEQRRPGKYKILESWHYDFSPDAAEHPVFHAQLTADHYPPTSAFCKYKSAHRVPGLKDLPRVPTAPLDLAAVLEIIAADHLDYHAIVDADAWRQTADALPRLPMAHLIASKFCTDKLRARHWYPKSSQ